ncbi:MAG: imidazole glycerol phosphate synthase subunit HisH [Candidatus Omnitrophica bacterium]|nr:imidazole glycerol phosphate synthase subunit HisH [Candidatus Omnitrophota bacterium]
MIAVIDYGMGNLRSVQKALEKLGAQATITDKANEILTAKKVVLPGVGAMAPAMEKLISLGLIESIKQIIKEKKPFLGICLGYQLLFEQSDEGGSIKGLGLLKGQVKRFQTLKVPHMGWNQLMNKQKNCPLFTGINNGDETYFCHSYYVVPTDTNVIATTTQYGIEFASSINTENIYGVQFHPEKSQTTGLKVLENFIKL